MPSDVSGFRPGRKCAHTQSLQAFETVAGVAAALRLLLALCRFIRDQLTKYNHDEQQKWLFQAVQAIRAQDGASAFPSLVTAANIVSTSVDLQ